jgi:hypothetical protein
MSPKQFKSRTSELALPDVIYEKYDNIVKGCKVCQDAMRAPPRSRVTGLRAQNFGDLIFIDHAEVHFRDAVYAVLLILDAATSLLWVAAQKGVSNAETIDNLRDRFDSHHCKPKSVVADMAFTTP